MSKETPSLDENINNSIENSDSNYHGINFSTFNYSPLIIDFDEKAFEDHLNNATLNLKDDFRCSSSASMISSIEASTFSSFLRIDSWIKVASVILCKKIDKILHLGSKTPAKVFETSNDRKPKLLFDLTSKPVTFEPDNLDCLEGPS